MAKEVRGLGVAGLRRLRQLEEENRKFKHLVADLSLDNVMLQDVFQLGFQFGRYCQIHLPECPVSSYSRIASICGWINSMKSRACCDKYRPFRATTP